MAVKRSFIETLFEHHDQVLPVSTILVREIAECALAYESCESLWLASLWFGFKKLNCNRSRLAKGLFIQIDNNHCGIKKVDFFDILSKVKSGRRDAKAVLNPHATYVKLPFRRDIVIEWLRQSLCWNGFFVTYLQTCHYGENFIKKRMEMEFYFDEIDSSSFPSEKHVRW